MSVHYKPQNVWGSKGLTGHWVLEVHMRLQDLDLLLDDGTIFKSISIKTCLRKVSRRIQSANKK